MTEFETFCNEVITQLTDKAPEKNYSTAGLVGENTLYDAVQEMCGGHHHGCGEIVYKARRFLAKGHSEDLIKIAAWSYLIWVHDRRDRDP